MIRKLTAALLAASFVTAGLAGTAQAKSSIRFATLAPKQSPWGKVFTAWQKAVEDKTKGEVEVQWLWNGTAGPENNMVGKIKSGQITGAAITAVGLSAIHKPIIALQMPGAFKSWAELDKARDALRPEFDKAMTEAGFYVSGWGDVGSARTMSNGFDVKVPDDLKGKTPGLLAQDIISPKVFEAIGGITAKPADVVEFLPLLNSGAINVLTAPSLAAEQLQWTSRLDHINDGLVGFGVGAMVISDKELSKLPKDQRDIMETTGKAAQLALLKIIRKEDDLSFERLQKKMTTHHETDAEKAEWEKIYKKACQRVKTAMPGDVLAKIGYC
ncbi:MAG TPA: TRAP transporter substrate-binding protein DctP [Polyangiaceae bacterium]|jgi:TRAP-type C4-dicarboxylate transport system substrate-binding protein|nr:TRAP transporter substrate-binding protein DctP [Polyangiaceae bacterium]